MIIFMCIIKKDFITVSKINKYIYITENQYALETYNSHKDLKKSPGSILVIIKNDK